MCYTLREAEAIVVRDRHRPNKLVVAIADGTAPKKGDDAERERKLAGKVGDLPSAGLLDRVDPVAKGGWSFTER